MYNDRLELYKKLEELRESKVLVYVTGDRPGFETQIARDSVDYFSDQLDKIGDVKKFLCFYILKAEI